MCVSSCAVSGRLASGGACKFSCVLLPLGGASRFEVLVCSHLQVVQRFFGFSNSLAHSFAVCLQFISEEEKWLFRRAESCPVRDGSAPVMFLKHYHHSKKNLSRPRLTGNTPSPQLCMVTCCSSPARQRSTGLDHATGPQEPCRDALHRPAWRPGSATVAGRPLPCHLPGLLPPDLHQVPPNLQQPNQHIQGTPPTRCRRSPHHSRPLRTHIPKAAQEAWARCFLAVLSGVISNNDTRGWSALLSLLKAGAPSGTQEQTKTANARPNDGRASNGLKGSGSQWQKPRTPSERKHDPDLPSPDSADDDDDLQRRDARATALTRRSHLPLARTALLDEHPTASRQRWHKKWRTEDQAKMMLLPVSLVSLATLPSISLVQDGRVSAHNTSKEGSSRCTETNLYGRLWPGQNPLPGPHLMLHRLPRSRRWVAVG